MAGAFYVVSRVFMEARKGRRGPSGVIPGAARNLALVRSLTKIQGGIPRCARNDMGLVFGLKKGPSYA
jgi:hypothetical protein